MRWALRFLGVGGSQAVELGSASAVIEHDDQPLLMIDCGQEALTAFMAHYGHAPMALFITHVHMDRVAGLEQGGHRGGVGRGWDSDTGDRRRRRR